MSLPSQIRRNLSSDLSDAQYAQAIQVATQIPHLQIAKAFFKVQGDRVVTKGSLAQLVVKARFIPPGSLNVPEIDPLDLEEIDPDEDDLDGLLGRAPPKNRRRKTIDGEPAQDDEAKKDPSAQIQPPLTHAPCFARDHSPRWYVFLSEPRNGKIVVPPFTTTAFDKPIIKADGSPTFAMQTLKFPFAAPPQVHAFNFTLHLVCDSYIGFDESVPVVLDVRDTKEAEVKAEESSDEISEPDEGQSRSMDPHRSVSHISISTFPKLSILTSNLYTQTR